MKRIIVISIAAATLALTGCGLLPAQSPETSTPTPTQSQVISDAKASIAAETKTPSPSSSPVSTRTAVIWADYDPGTQAEIDLFTKAKDCRGLQSYVGMATATEASVKAKTGHGNDALLKYIGESLALAGCS